MKMKYPAQNPHWLSTMEICKENEERKKNGTPGENKNH